MRLSKTISALFLSFVILFASLTQANAKRLHAAIADWTGGIITCEVAVAILEREMGYKINKQFSLLVLDYGKQLQLENLISLARVGQVMQKQMMLCLTKI